MAGSGAAQRINDRREVDRLGVLREAIRAATLRSEPDAIREMLGLLVPVERRLEGAKRRAVRWVEAARADQRPRPFVDSMLERFPLDSAQGKALMSLAEALLRTPDPRRADQLIAERLAAVRNAGRARVGGTRAEMGSGGIPALAGCGTVAPVTAQSGARGEAAPAGAGSGGLQSDDLLLRTGFALLGAASRLLPDVANELSGRFSIASITKPLVAPVVRKALRGSMQMLGQAFIVGETIETALLRGESHVNLS